MTILLDICVELDINSMMECKNYHVMQSITITKYHNDTQVSIDSVSGVLFKTSLSYYIRFDYEGITRTIQLGIKPFVVDAVGKYWISAIINPHTGKPNRSFTTKWELEYSEFYKVVYRVDFGTPGYQTLIFNDETLLTDINNWVYSEQDMIARATQYIK